MTGYHLLAVAVGLAGFLLMRQGPRQPTLRWLGWIWLALWCLPPLVILWIRSTFG